MTKKDTYSKVIRLKDKYNLFDQHWTPKNLATCNDQLVKIAKVQGDFIWHKHEAEDELFLVIKGKLYIELRNEIPLELNEGDMAVIPKGMEHRPYTDGSECWILMIEPPETRNTGEHRNELSVEELDWI